MAKVGYTLVCLLVLVATLAQCVLGLSTLASSIGSIHVFNAGDYDMSIQSTVQFDNGGSRTDPVYPLPQKGTAFQFQVLDGMDCVSALFTMTTPSGKYNQLVTDWCSKAGSMPVPCVPNCFWIVDDTGFSVGNSEYAQQLFVTGWNVPHQA